MYYSKIHGHFNYEFLYNEMVEKFNSKSIFVEIGAYLGKSTCFLAEKLINSGKDIELNIIDNWIGHPSDKALVEEIKQLGNIYNIFITNMTNAKVIDRLNIIRGDSTETATKFKDSSVDFVFIDAAHDYESVKRDINAWFPKMRTAGVIAGHDYKNTVSTGVDKAVDEIFGNRIRIVENTWIHYIDTQREILC